MQVLSSKTCRGLWGISRNCSLYNPIHFTLHRVVWWRLFTAQHHLYQWHHTAPQERAMFPLSIDHLLGVKSMQLHDSWLTPLSWIPQWDYLINIITTYLHSMAGYPPVHTELLKGSFSVAMKWVIFYLELALALSDSSFRVLVMGA